MNIYVTEFIPNTAYDILLSSLGTAAEHFNESVGAGKTFKLPAANSASGKDEYYLNVASVTIANNGALSTAIPSDLIYNPVGTGTWGIAGVRHVIKEEDGHKYVDPTSVPYKKVLRGVCQDYISLVWNDKMFDVGDFTLALIDTPENRELFQANRWLEITKSDTIMIIETVETNAALKSDGYIMTVSGRSLSSILDRRIAFPGIGLNTYDCTTDYGFIYGINRLVRAYFEDPTMVIATDTRTQQQAYYYPERRIDPFRIDDTYLDYIDTEDTCPNFPDGIPMTAINTTVSKDIILETVKKQCKGADIGFKIDYEEVSEYGVLVFKPTLIFRLYKGRKRTYGSSSPLVFSPLLSNMDSVAVTNDIKEYKNVVFCGKEKDSENYIDFTKTSILTDATSILGEFVNANQSISKVKNWLSTNLQDNDICRTGVVMLAVAASRTDKSYDSTVSKIEIWRGDNVPYEEWPKNDGQYTYPTSLVGDRVRITYDKVIGGTLSDPSGTFETITLSVSGITWVEDFKRSTGYGWLSANVMKEAKANCSLSLSNGIVTVAKSAALRAWFSSMDSYTTSYTNVKWLCAVHNSGEPGSTGLERREVFVDEESEDDTNWSEADVYNMKNRTTALTTTEDEDEDSDEKILVKLNDSAIKQSGNYKRKHDIDAKCNGDVTVYKKDYELGDIVQVDDGQGNKAAYAISAVAITNDTSKGEQVIPTFDEHKDVPEQYTKLEWLSVSQMTLPDDILYNELSTADPVETPDIPTASSGLYFGFDRNPSGPEIPSGNSFEKGLPFTSKKDKIFTLTDISFEAAFKAKAQDGQEPYIIPQNDVAIISADGYERHGTFRNPVTGSKIAVAGNEANCIMRDYPMMIKRSCINKVKSDQDITGHGTNYALSAMEYKKMANNHTVTYGHLYEKRSSAEYGQYCKHIFAVNGGKAGGIKLTTPETNINQNPIFAPGCGYKKYADASYDDPTVMFKSNLHNTEISIFRENYGTAQTPSYETATLSNIETFDKFHINSHDENVMITTMRPYSGDAWISLINRYSYSALCNVYYFSMGYVYSGSDNVYYFDGNDEKRLLYYNETGREGQDDAFSRTSLYAGKISGAHELGYYNAKARTAGCRYTTFQYDGEFPIIGLIMKGPYEIGGSYQTNTLGSNYFINRIANGTFTYEQYNAYIKANYKSVAEGEVWLFKASAPWTDDDNIQRCYANQYVALRWSHNLGYCVAIPQSGTSETGWWGWYENTYSPSNVEAQNDSVSFNMLTLFYSDSTSPRSVGPGTDYEKPYIAVYVSNRNDPARLRIGFGYLLALWTGSGSGYGVKVPVTESVLKTYLHDKPHPSWPFYSGGAALKSFPRLYNAENKYTQIKMNWKDYFSKCIGNGYVNSRPFDITPYGTALQDYESEEYTPFSRRITLGGYRYFSNEEGKVGYFYDSDFADINNGYAFKEITFTEYTAYDRKYEIANADMGGPIDKGGAGTEDDYYMPLDVRYQLVDNSSKKIAHVLVPVRYNGADGNDWSKLSNEEKYGFYDTVTDRFIPINYGGNLAAKFCGSGPELQN